MIMDIKVGQEWRKTKEGEGHLWGDGHQSVLTVFRVSSRGQGFEKLKVGGQRFFGKRAIQKGWVELVKDVPPHWTEAHVTYDGSGVYTAWDETGESSVCISVDKLQCQVELVIYNHYEFGGNLKKNLEALLSTLD